MTWHQTALAVTRNCKWRLLATRTKYLCNTLRARPPNPLLRIITPLRGSRGRVSRYHGYEIYV